MKRFSWSGSEWLKNSTLITFNSTLDLSPVCWREAGGERGSNMYNLCGIVVHEGSPIEGHYKAYTRSAAGAWYHMNDSVVCEVSSAE